MWSACKQSVRLLSVLLHLLQLVHILPEDLYAVEGMTPGLISWGRLSQVYHLQNIY